MHASLSKHNTRAQKTPQMQPIRATTSVTTTTTTLLTKRLSHGLSDKACRHNWQNRRESTKNAVHHEASLGDQPSMKTSRVAAFDRHRGIFLVEAHIATILKTRV